MVAASCQYRLAVLICIATYFSVVTYAEKLKTANYACPETGIDYSENDLDREAVVLAYILNFNQDDSSGIVRFQILETIKTGPTTTAMSKIEEEASAILGEDFASRCHMPQEGSVVLHLVVGDGGDWLVTRIVMPTTKDCK